MDLEDYISSKNYFKKPNQECQWLFLTLDISKLNSSIHNEGYLHLEVEIVSKIILYYLLANYYSQNY